MKSFFAIPQRLERLIRVPLVLFMFIASPIFLFSQDFSLENFSLWVTPRILEHGNVTDVGLGYQYSPNFFGTFRFRLSSEMRNETLDIDGLEDSLNAMDQKNYEFFFLPVNRYLIQNYSARLAAGLGFYYNYLRLHEKGFFNMPDLEFLGRARINSYENDFSMHTMGPVFDIGFNGRAENFSIASGAGIVPLFGLFSEQRMKISPLFETGSSSYSQQKAGSPYIYMDLNIVLFRYFSLSGFYEFTRLEYQAVNFNDNLRWIRPSQVILTNSVKLEAAALIPIVENVNARIGLGYAWNSMQRDSGNPVWDRQFYFIVSTALNYERR